MALKNYTRKTLWLILEPHVRMNMHMYVAIQHIHELVQGHPLSCQGLPIMPCMHQYKLFAVLLSKCLASPSFKYVSLSHQVEHEAKNPPIASHFRHRGQVVRYSTVHSRNNMNDGFPETPNLSMRGIYPVFRGRG